MKLDAWYRKRGMGFIAARAQRLVGRYGLRSEKSMRRIEHCVQALEAHGCHPTFAVPGIVVERNLPFIRRLQDQGVEIAVHGYNHVDLKAYPPENASRQLLRAAELFHADGLEVHGFRCPYLSITDEVVRAIPSGIFEYSSNRAIQWPLQEIADTPRGPIFRTIQEFYLPSKAESQICIPREEDSLLEIPVCVPDDLQLHDGLGCGPDEISKVWSDLLHQTYRRGEALNLMFHPELVLSCERPLVSLLQEAGRLRPAVWVVRLCDLSSWWSEKSVFRVDVVENADDLRIAFACSDRATILARGLEDVVAGDFWDGRYWRLHGREFTLPAHPRPLVGLPKSTSPAVLSFLREQGYILETGERALDCGTYIGESVLARLTDRVQLINYIEAAPGPLIRLWRWPNGCKSAMCITGDLDALSLTDYASRLFSRSTN